MTTPIGYKVHLNLTQTSGDIKAKVGRDAEGNKVITFFQRTKEPGLVGKLNDFRKNIMDGEKAAKKYLQGQFISESGSSAFINLKQKQTGQTKESRLAEHLMELITRDVVAIVKHHPDKLKEDPRAIGLDQGFSTVPVKFFYPDS